MSTDHETTEPDKNDKETKTSGSKLMEYLARKIDVGIREDFLRGDFD